MRKKLYMSFIMIGVVSLVVHVFIPHHEHKDKVCFEFSLCDNINDDTSENTKTSPGKVQSCCLDTQDILPQKEKVTKYTCNDNTCEYHYPSVFLFIGSIFDFEIGKPVKIDKPYLSLYSSIDILPANTFRGPPQI